jgi:hypothetical protein
MTVDMTPSWRKGGESLSGKRDPPDRSQWNEFQLSLSLYLNPLVIDGHDFSLDRVGYPPDDPQVHHHIFAMQFIQH